MTRALWQRLVLGLMFALAAAAGAFSQEQEQIVPHTTGTGELHLLVEDLKAQLTDSPDDVDLLVSLGNAYYDLQLYNEARDTYQKVLEIYPDHAGAHLNLGTVYSDMRQHDDAIREYKIALELNPMDAAAWSNLGSVYYAKAMYPESMAQYRRALEIDPDNPEAHFNLGVAFADVQMFDEAIVEWEKVIEVAPGTPAAVLCGSNIRMIRDFRGEAPEKGSLENAE